MIISPDELRKGNLLLLKKDWNRIKLEQRLIRVDVADIDCIYQITNEGRFGVDYELIEGIKITDDILLKAGFIKVSQVDCDYQYLSLKLCYDFDSNSYFMYGFSETEYKYLHELQNLVYALFKEELKINLL